MSAARSGISALRKIKGFTPRLPQRLKGGTVEKWVKYWQMVVKDYKEVFVDVIKESREKPVKAAFYISFLSGLAYAFRTNPDKKDFLDNLQFYLNESALLSDKIRNPEVDAHYTYMKECFDLQLVRRISLGIGSFLWIDNYSNDCGLFKTSCSYLKPQFLTFHNRIVDVGCFGQWWAIREKLKDFDINPEEWKEESPAEKKE
ncbi:mitochondrial import inner membrane translocase subunit Tim29 [Oratosquilla oratoria]|uniref:mitochondrial import inner membrane translocase subunit Tim29 n=1 Tax=Oratosquilla oratoria TaxID=337810 RepID=UPI003F7759BC